jgi:predicted HicB family RNase H-like nuclease
MRILEYSCWDTYLLVEDYGTCPMKTAEPKIPLNVNIPVTLKRDIAAAADALGQSLTTWITRTLNAALRREPHSDRNGVTPNIGDAL